MTESNTQHASEAIAARGQMLFTYSPGGIYEVQAATFHETALALQPGEVADRSGSADGRGYRPLDHRGDPGRLAAQ